jgi:hypothetical protein
VLKLLAVSDREQLIAAADHLAVQRDYRGAAELRVQALGPKPYPVLICSECCTVTGWLGSDGTCAPCWLRRTEHASNSFAAPAAVSYGTARRPLGSRLAHTLRGSRAQDRALAWLGVVAPGETGPIEPEDGWDLEVPVKTDVPAPEGPHRIVRFDAQSMRFERGNWSPCATSHGGKPRVLVPREFPATLPIEQLAEAWNDFEEEVAVHNRAVWAAEAARRDAPRELEGDDERGTAALLG